MPFRPFEDYVEYGHWDAEAGPTVLDGCTYAQTVNGPQPLDVAYLDDLGYDVAPDAKADAPEMYTYGA